MHSIDPSQRNYLPSALRWLESISSGEYWKLTCDDLALILDDQASNIESLIQRARTHGKISQDDELTDKISLLIQVHKHLSRIVPSKNGVLPIDWFNQSNNDPLFAGMTIKEYLCTHSPPDSIMKVVAYLSAY